MSFFPAHNGFLSLGRLMLAGSGGSAPSWVEPGALADIDTENGRFWYNNRVYPTIDAVASAMGGVRSGNALTIGPYDTGNLLYQSNFSPGVDGFAETLNPSNGDISASGGNLIGTVTTGQYRYAKAISVSRIAAVASATRISTNQASISLGIGNTSGLSGAASATTPLINGRSTVVGSTETSTMHVGLLTNGAGQTTSTDYTVKEALPYAGYLQLQTRFEFDFTAPASFSTQKMIAMWGIGNTGQSIRLLINTSGELRLILTISNTTETVNLNLGVISTGSRHKISGSVADNGSYASLDGGPLVADTDVGNSVPAVGLFWIGRSFTGETFDGTIHRATLWAESAGDPNQFIDPAKAFRIYGDSTAVGEGSTTDWFQVLTSEYSPERAYSRNAAGGETSTEMLARVLASADFYRDWPTIFMDRPNTGENVALWISNMKAAVAHLRTDKWYVHPPVQNVPDTSISNIASVQTELLSDSFFTGHTLSSSEQLSYISAMNDPSTRSDGVHDSDAGAVVRADTIKAWADGAGW